MATKRPVSLVKSKMTLAEELAAERKLLREKFLSFAEFHKAGATDLDKAGFIEFMLKVRPFFTMFQTESNSVYVFPD